MTIIIHVYSRPNSLPAGLSCVYTSDMDRYGYKLPQSADGPQKIGRRFHTALKVETLYLMLKR